MVSSERSVNSLPAGLSSPVKRDFPFKPVASKSARDEGRGRSSPYERELRDLHDGGFREAQAGPSNGNRYQQEPTPPHRVPLAPPPLAPYVNAERRYFAPRPSQEQWLGPNGRRPSSQGRPTIAPLTKPPPPHIVAAMSAGSGSRDGQVQPERSQSFSSALPSTYYPFSPSRPSTSEAVRLLPSPPDSRGAGYRSYPPPLSGMPIVIPHTHSQHNSQSSMSVTSRHSIQSEPMIRDLSGGSSISGSSRTGGMTMASEPVHGAELQFMRKKRTRALMTHNQQAGLARLWKRTKFPTGLEREQLGQEIGLTPRQVQVWFQNQRQKGRKTLAENGGIPDGADPADYEDLQKSPRSRRLSMEQDDPASAWAGSSSSSNSTVWPGPLDPPQLPASSSHPVVTSAIEPPHGALGIAIGSRASSPIYEKWDKMESMSHSISEKPNQNQNNHSQYRSNHVFKHQDPFHRHYRQQPYSHRPRSPAWDSNFSSSTRSSSSRPPTGAPLSPPRTSENKGQSRSSSWLPLRSPDNEYDHLQRKQINLPPMRMANSLSPTNGPLTIAATARNTTLPPTLAKMVLDGPVDRAVTRGEADLPSILPPSPSPAPPQPLPTSQVQTGGSGHGNEIGGRREYPPTSLSSLID